MSTNHWNLAAITTICLLSISDLSCQGQLPKSWSPDMELSTYNGGGMVPETKTVVIKSSSGSSIHRLKSQIDTLAFVFSQQELNDLLKEMNAAHFNNITSAKTNTTAYDKPTTSIEFKWGNNVHKVSDGATEEVSNSNSTIFYKLYSYIDSLVQAKTRKTF